jgi:hypothetical protein
LTGLLGERVKLCSRCEEVTVGFVDAHVVSLLGWFPEILDSLTEQSDPGEEVVDSMAQCQRKLPCRSEEAEVVDTE